MTDLEKVIKGLEQHMKKRCLSGKEQLQPVICPYFQESDCIIELCCDALELLKQREPRVLTLEEIWEYGDDKPLFIEYVLPTETVMKPAIFQPDNSEKDVYMCVVSAWRASGFYSLERYGKDWRCWTARPTDEQREATPWGEPPKEGKA